MFKGEVFSFITQLFFVRFWAQQVAKVTVGAVEEEEGMVERIRKRLKIF